MDSCARDLARLSRTSWWLGHDRSRSPLAWLSRGGVVVVAIVVAGLSHSMFPGDARAATGCVPATQSATTITVSETWTAACSPYIVNANVTVQNGATLTIEPGVVVKFNSTRTLTIATAAQGGGLIAAGTTLNPIRFTSNQTTPTPGFWQGLTFNQNVLSGSVLTNAIIEYAGVNPSLRLTSVPGPAITISSVEIRQCTTEGVGLSGGDPVMEYMTINCPGATKHGVVATGTTGFVIRHSTIANAVSAISAGTSGGVTDTTYTNYSSGLGFNLHASRVGAVIGNNTVAGSTSASIVTVTGGLITQSATWQAFSYRITGDVTVRAASAPMLTISPGAELRFGTNNRLLVSTSAIIGTPGGISAVGTPAAPIRFTSNAASPAPGNWGGIQRDGAGWEFNWGNPADWGVGVKIGVGVHMGSASW